MDTQLLNKNTERHLPRLAILTISSKLNFGKLRTYDVSTALPVTAGMVWGRSSEIIDRSISA